jgi:hypothetical protein
MRGIVLAVLLAGIPACAGTFLIKNDRILLYQEHDRITLLLANPLEGMAEEIALTFPGLVQLEDVYVHAGIMKPTQGRRELVLSGALWQQGFVRLSWKPAALLPLTISARSATEEWTLELSHAFVYGDPEILKLPQGILVGRSEGIGQTLRIRFGQSVVITSILGIGCNPTWEVSDQEVALSGPFPPGSMVLVAWDRPEVQVKEVLWNDRPASTCPSGLWEVMDLGSGRFRFSVAASSDVQVFWDLGDGTTATGQSFEHIYSHDGKYLVTLVLSDKEGQRRIRQTWVTVERPALALAPSPTLLPHAVLGGPYGPLDFEYIWDEELQQYVYRSPVWFDASASQAPGSKIVAYIWDLGDGHRIVTDSPYLTYTYVFTKENLPPRYEPWYRKVDVTLTIVDETGRTSTATTYVLFHDIPW